MKRQRGITLIELMIVLAVVAILGGLALPSYIQYLQRSNRSDAYTALLNCAAEQERWFTANNTYLTDAAAAANGRCGIPSGGIRVSPEQYYQISVDASGGTCTAGVGTCFIATATAIGSQADDVDCPSLTIDDNGLQLPADCWRK